MRHRQRMRENKDVQVKLKERERREQTILARTVRQRKCEKERGDKN